MASYKVPFNRSSIVGNEQAYIAQAVASGQVAGDQAFGKRCQALLEAQLGAPRVLLTTSCTHALELSALLLDVGPGDEVIVPSFTFVSTVNAFVLRGAKPVFIDVRPDTLNLDETKLAELLTAKTKAVVPVHYGGVGCEMDEILAITQRRGVAVVEDNAHGLFGSYRGRALGTFGQFATQSFHETKNVTCGEGGALVINEEGYASRAEIMREKGTDRAKFFRGEVDKYTWVDIGSSYVMSDVLAAFLYGQLEQRQAIQARRQAIWTAYDRQLADWAKAREVRTPVVPAHCAQAYHLYYLLLPTAAQRDRLLVYLRERGILAVFHYLPLHLSPMGRAHGGEVGQCPVTEELSARLIRLPFYNSMSDDEQAYVVEMVTGFR